jgi:hypothetical protein
MSEFNNEQYVASTERRKALKGVEATLRDQIPGRLAELLDEKGIGQKVSNVWQIGNANRTTWLERQQVYLKDWDEFLVSTSMGPFSGSSNLHIPLPLVISKTIHARFMQALMGIDPPFLIKGRTEGEQERADLITGLVRYILQDHCNEFDGIEETVDRWLWDWVTTGSAIVKGRWDCVYERFVDVEEYQKPGPPQYRTNPQTGRQEMHRTTQKAERDVTKTVTKFEGMYFDHKLMEDILIIGGVGGDPQKADIVMDRYFLTASDIWTLVDRNLFREEEARTVIAQGRDHTMGAIAGNIKLQRAHDAGKVVYRSTAELDRFEILESYMKFDVDGSGINSEIVVWVHYRSRLLLRANYLRRMIKSGERPFFKIDYHKRPESEYGVGIVEMMHPLSVETDALHNMRIDFGLLSTMPFGFYRSTSNVQPEILNIEPGALIPLDNPQTDVYFPNLGNRTAWGFQEEEAIYTLVERLTSISDINQGVMTGAQGPTRTATGARALLGESNSNLDVYLRRLNRGWKKLLQFTFHMLQQRLPPGFMFRVLGDDGQDVWKVLQDRSELMGDFDFQVVPNSTQSNIQIQQETAQNIVQMTQNPLDIQLGLVTPQTRYEALKNWYKTNNVKEFSRYLTKPKDYQYIPTPMEEVQRLLRGMDVPVLPNADHQGFVDYVTMIQKDPDLLGQWTVQQSQVIFAQLKKHQQMLQALQEMQAQQANANQMRQNAQNAFQQASPGQNPMLNAPPAGAQSPPAPGGGGQQLPSTGGMPGQPPQVQVTRQ